MFQDKSLRIWAYGLSFVLAIATRSPIFSQDVYEGMATHFDGLGSPYGGCGVPQNLLETQNFLALNAFNSPENYSTFPLPDTGGPDTVYIGEFGNGSNCGRWAEVTIGAYCTGTNDGAPNEPFCRGTGAAWIDDSYSGAVLDMLVADCCPDANAWCRDSRYHLDLATASLNLFVKNSVAVGDMNPDHWNNREITWHYIQAPNYSGDVRIFFIQGAQIYWPAILITHLQNGIHGVQQKTGTNWVTAKRNAAMGQSFILPSTSAGASTFTIRIFDASNLAINNSREYTFSIPASCGNSCSNPATEITYTTFDPNARISTGSQPGNKSIRMTCSQGMLSWQVPSNNPVKVIVRDILGRTVLGENSIAGNSGKGSTNLKGLKAGIFIAELNVHGSDSERLLFARP
ncbi:MAG: hypothetical protein WBM07_06310 [Chitinivibrionales bacterium]